MKSLASAGFQSLLWFSITLVTNMLFLPFTKERLMGSWKEIHYPWKEIIELMEKTKQSWRQVFVVIQSLSCVQLLCNPTDCSPPGSSLHGISQARILEWVAIFFSRGSSQSRDQSRIFCIDKLVLYQGATGDDSFPLLKTKKPSSPSISSIHSYLTRNGVT